MTLRAFSVSGDAVLDEGGEPDQHGDLPLLKQADPARTIRRYDELGESRPVSVRINEQLLMAAKDLPIVVVRLSPLEQTTSDNEAASNGGRKESDWISDGLRFYWDIFEFLEQSDFYTCYLADRFGPSPNRIHYFVSEQPANFIDFVQRRALERGFSVACDQTELRRIAPDFLPIEMIGHLGLDSGDTKQRVKVGFGFGGQEDSLTRLRRRLERDGYVFDEYVPYLRELQMAKEAPVDQASFLEMLQELVPLSRSLGCSYKGEETIRGHEQFLLTAPKPEQYYPQKRTFMSRLLGS